MDEGLGHRGQELGVLLRQGGEVQAGSREEVLGLADVHPEALEVKGVQQAVLDDGREGLLLDGRGAELDAVEHRGVEDVDARINAVADELDGLLDEAVDARRVAGLVDDDSVLGRLLDLGHHDGALVAVGLVEGGELLEGVLAGDVGIEHKEGGLVFPQDLLG